MDQYEDLQKFNEKTHMKSIRFIDFTKQNKEVNHGHWSIMQQLAGGNAPATPAPPSGLKLPIPDEPVPFKAANPAHLTPLDMNQAPLTTKPQAEKYASSLVKEIGTQLNRSVSSQPEAQQAPQAEVQVQAQPQFQPQSGIQAQAQFQPQPGIQAQSQYQPQPGIQVQPQFQLQPGAQEPLSSNFSHLFATSSVDKPSVDGKDAPLQSLLKRIATCR
ncbi:cellulose biosynthesis protein BcsO [Citrobacter sp. JGM124]|nr:cellulose biosynthesis protein BcsO [Citrobacter sp. JGM124]